MRAWLVAVAILAGCGGVDSIAQGPGAVLEGAGGAWTARPAAAGGAPRSAGGSANGVQAGGAPSLVDAGPEAATPEASLGTGGAQPALDAGVAYDAQQATGGQLGAGGASSSGGTAPSAGGARPVRDCSPGQVSGCATSVCYGTTECRETGEWGRCLQPTGIECPGGCITGLTCSPDLEPIPCVRGNPGSCR